MVSYGKEATERYVKGVTRGGEDYKILLLEAAGGWMSTSEVASLIGVPRSAVMGMIDDGRLLAYGSVVSPSLPACQIVDGSIVPGLGETLRALTVEGFWSKLSFLLAPDELLAGRRPLEALRSGDLDAVLGAAKAFGKLAN